MKNEIQLSDLQTAVMRVIWSSGEATAAKVHQELLEARGLAFTTVATTLKRMENRGLIDHRTEGRQFIYRPLVSEKDVRVSMVSGLIDRLFKGDSAELVNHLITEKQINNDDLEKVKALIASAEKRESGK